MDILQISVIAIVGIVTAIVLKGYKPEFSIFIIIALSFFLAAKGIGNLPEVKPEFQLIQSFYQENEYYYRILFRIVGITYLCEFTSGICKDAGYQSVSGQVELLGKMLILVSGMPVLLAIVETLWKYEL